MRLPVQSASVRQDSLYNTTVIVTNDTAINASCQTSRLHRGMRRLVASPSQPGRAAPVDHELFIMLASGCNCISPNCVALSCPAECVRNGKFIC